MTSNHRVATVVTALALSSALSLALLSSAGAEQARPAAPDRGPCSRAEVEKAVRALDEATLLRVVKAPPANEAEELVPVVNGWKVGRFLDRSCNVALVAISKLWAAMAYRDDEAVFLKLAPGGLAIAARLSIPDHLNPEFRLEPIEVVDLDHDGRDELVTTENEFATGDPDYTGIWKHFGVRRVRDKAIESLWNPEDESWPVVDQCRTEKGPCDVGTNGLSYVDLDGDGMDEIVLRATKAVYRDPAHKKLVSHDELRQVFWFDGKRYGAKRSTPLTDASLSKVSPSPLAKLPAGAVARFRARLTAQDHSNGQSGAPLTFAAQVIRQDRANLHAKGTKRPDPEDTVDSLYGTTEARGALTTLLEKAIPPAEADRILKGTPLVDVTVWTDRAEVLVLSE